MHDFLVILAAALVAWGLGLALVFRIIPAAPRAVVAAVDLAAVAWTFLHPAARHRKSGATHV